MPTARSHSLQARQSSDSTASTSSETPYERLLDALHNDARWLNDVNLGKRVGFYRFRGDLGFGNFSQVKLAVHQLTREAVAIKVLDKSKLDERTRKMLSREISVMEAIYHPNIIRLYEVVETYSKIHLVMEYASGGELFNRITAVGKIPEDIAKLLFAQVVSAVMYMHENNFIHRDIKAENVFYSSSNLVKLGDFGFSTQLTSGSNQQLQTFCGSPPYAAPELFHNESYLGAPVDIWALGILLYFVVTAQMPFKAQTVAALKQYILQGVYAPPQVSPSCKQLIEAILKQPPHERLSLEKIKNSEWLRDTPVPSRPGVSERYILTPTMLPRKCSIVTLNGLECAQAKASTDPQKDPADSNRRRETVHRTTSAQEKSPSKLAAQQNGARSRQNSTDLPTGTPKKSVDGDKSRKEAQQLLQEQLANEYRDVGMCEIEIKARERLDALGISAAMLEEHQSIGSRSSIIGAYRILVHRSQKLQSNAEHETQADKISVSSASQNANAQHFLTSLMRRKSKSATMKTTKNGPKVLLRNRSKTCVII